MFETDFGGVRLEDCDKEGVEGEVCEGYHSVHITGKGEIQLLWGSDLDYVH